MIRRVLLAGLLVVTGAGAAWAGEGVALEERYERVVLEQRYESLPPEAKSLLDQLFLTDQMQEAAKYWRSMARAGPRGFSIALVDLNGDGVDEALVAHNTFVFCGTAPSCPVSVYRREGTGWRFAGKFDAVRPNMTLYVFVEDARRHGWRNLNNGPVFYDWGWGDKFGGTRLCWSDGDPFYLEIGYDRGSYGGEWHSGDGAYVHCRAIDQP